MILECSKSPHSTTLCPQEHLTRESVIMAQHKWKNLEGETEHSKEGFFSHTILSYYFYCDSWETFYQVYPFGVCVTQSVRLELDIQEQNSFILFHLIFGTTAGKSDSKQALQK